MDNIVKELKEGGFLTVAGAYIFIGFFLWVGFSAAKLLFSLIGL